MGTKLVAGFAGSRSEVPALTAVRSTWVASSVLGVREHGMYDRYVAGLAREHVDAVLGAVAGEAWVPVDAFAAHYAACDALGLAEDEMVALGARTTRQIHGTMIDLARRLAREAGATPWAALSQAPRLFDRVAKGGAVCLHQVGPKDAQIELFGYPVAKYTYARLTMRGAVRSLAAIFGHKAYVQDAPRLCSATSLGYRVAWA